MQRDIADTDAIALALAQIALEAGILLRDMQKGAIAPRLKEDGSPTTAADLAAERLIIQRLQALWPDIPVIAEETASKARANQLFFLVDPLDGTKDYINGTDEFSVNIALIQGHRPTAAAIAAPALSRLWAAGEMARAATVEPDGAIRWRPIKARTAPASLTALVSRRHGDEETEACLCSLDIGARRPTSSAVKFGLIAEGEADLYVRCGPTMEWDTAAGDHIVTRAGGCVIGPDHRPLTYGHEERAYLNGPFAALGDATLAPRLHLPLKTA
ncbi:3'(2'),5'-bisphosphate nucleotidase CysQ family protein [Microvirga flavescens]|uniref:3'(2'),5'-bisphosphate nucleotidase CysQ family protein n=1 Tax=Microvirga flavescens TaxID=2249811 RepID=UPI000DDBF9F0|nr:3'(2'),5'-bisphosphate nucleotidase CysQ [Microvirga flavescens]